jgi:response regulator RpfG family c-di-GMP phosphodiesterase
LVVHDSTNANPLGGKTVSRKVLDVGQCNPDHSRISKFLKREFDVEVQRAYSFDEAVKSALDTPFDLILINRILDADGTAGMAILHELKSQPSTADVPVMIVSNYQDAQDTAVESGAVRGFGKSELNNPATKDSLAEYLVG